LEEEEEVEEAEEAEGEEEEEEEEEEEAYFAARTCVPSSLQKPFCVPP
jgi:hypothetical protein